MVDLTTLQFVRDTVAIVGVIAAFIYYVLTVRNQTKSRQTQMFMELHEAKYDRDGLEAFFNLYNRKWKDFDDHQQKYGPMTHPDQAAIMESQISYMDGLGILVQEGMVDIDLVYKIAGRRIIQLWHQLETVIKGLREMAPGPGPDYSEYFEYLANEMIKIRRGKGLPLFEDRLHPTSTLHQEHKI